MLYLNECMMITEIVCKCTEMSGVLGSALESGNSKHSALSWNLSGGQLWCLQRIGGLIALNILVLCNVDFWMSLGIIIWKLSDPCFHWMFCTSCGFNVLLTYWCMLNVIILRVQYKYLSRTGVLLSVKFIGSIVGLFINCNIYCYRHSFLWFTVYVWMET